MSLHHATPLTRARRGAAYRSVLFVPGDRPERFAKAGSSGADAVCVDLEDAVSPDRKNDARTALHQFLADRPEGGPVVIVRLNPPDSEEWRRDAATIAKERPDAIIVPKVKTEEEVKWASDVFGGGLPILPLIETAQALDNVTWIGASTPAVVGLVFGGFDLSLELGAEPGWDSLLYARSRIVHAAALNAITAIDMPSREIAELESLRDEADRARRMGFSGKVAIHPDQIPVIHEIFTPSDQEVAWAKRVIDASREAHQGVAVVDGKMVDRPITEAARRILARAGDAEPE